MWWLWGYPQVEGLDNFSWRSARLCGVWRKVQAEAVH